MKKTKIVGVLLVLALSFEMTREKAWGVLGVDLWLMFQIIVGILSRG